MDAPGSTEEELQQYRDAIAAVESKGQGDYAAQGPWVRRRDGSYDRAYGRYQVMGNNVPEWTEAATGKRATKQEFMASPEMQDAVFNHRFGGYVNQYGNPQDAASVWFTGLPLARGGSASDHYITGNEYVRRFNNALQRNSTSGALAYDQEGQRSTVTGGKPSGDDDAWRASMRQRLGIGQQPSQQSDQEDEVWRQAILNHLSPPNTRVAQGFQDLQQQPPPSPTKKRGLQLPSLIGELPGARAAADKLEDYVGSDRVEALGSLMKDAGVDLGKGYLYGRKHFGNAPMALAAGAGIAAGAKTLAPSNLWRLAKIGAVGSLVEENLRHSQTAQSIYHLFEGMLH